MSWRLFRRYADAGAALSIGIETDLLESAPDLDHPVACQVSIAAVSAAPEQLAQTEDAMLAIIARLGGRVAATQRRSDEFVMLSYLPGPGGTDDFASVPLPAGATVSTEQSSDPGWAQFDRYRPDGMEEQSLQDLQIFGELFAAGDRGGIRPIDHVIVGVDVDRMQSFLDAVGSVVGPITSSIDSVSGSVTVTQQGDPADITGDSWTVRLIAERHGGSYDGWGCAVQGAAPQSRRKRRWRRR